MKLLGNLSRILILLGSLVTLVACKQGGESAGAASSSPGRVSETGGSESPIDESFPETLPVPTGLPAVSRQRCELPGSETWARVTDAGAASSSVYGLWARFPDRGDEAPDVYPATAELQDILPAGWVYLDHFLGSFERRGFASLSSHDGTCYLAFKGTEDPGDALRDAEGALLTECRTRTGESMGRCGRGFFTIIEGLRDRDASGERGQIIDRVRDWQDGGACPGGVVVTGHSLGGALADVFAANYLAETGRVLSVITFAAPRTFSREAANRLQQTLGDHKIRIVRRGDFAPSYPPRNMGFEHFGAVFELSQGSVSNLGQWFLWSQPVEWQPIPGPYHFIAQYREGIEAACSSGGRFDQDPSMVAAAPLDSSAL